MSPAGKSAILTSLLDLYSSLNCCTLSCDMSDIIISVEVSSTATRLILKSSQDTIITDSSIRNSITLS